MKSILKKIYTNLRKKSITPYSYSERYVKLDDVYDEIFKAEKEYNEKCIMEIRNKAIDEFANFIHEKAKENNGLRLSGETRSWTHASIFDYVNEFREKQMKGV